MTEYSVRFDAGARLARRQAPTSTSPPFASKNFKMKVHSTRRSRSAWGAQQLRELTHRTLLSSDGASGRYLLPCRNDKAQLEACKQPGLFTPQYLCAKRQAVSQRMHERSPCRPECCCDTYPEGVVEQVQRWSRDAKVLPRLPHEAPLRLTLTASLHGVIGAGTVRTGGLMLGMRVSGVSPTACHSLGLDGGRLAYNSGVTSTRSPSRLSRLENLPTPRPANGRESRTAHKDSTVHALLKAIRDALGHELAYTRRGIAHETYALCDRAGNTVKHCATPLWSPGLAFHL